MRTRLATEADAAAIARIYCAAADRRTVRSEDYAGVAEFSVYVDRANRGTGAGRAASGATRSSSNASSAQPRVRH